MLKNISESITNIIKLLVSVTQLALLLAIFGGGFWAYTRVSGFLSNPISLPDIRVPKVHIEAPDIELPSIKLPGQKPKVADESLWHDPDTGEYMVPPPAPAPLLPPTPYPPLIPPPANPTPRRATPPPAAPRYDTSKIQV